MSRQIFMLSLINHTCVPGFQVKEGLSWVLFSAIASHKTHNLALPWLENLVGVIETASRWVIKSECRSRSRQQRYSPPPRSGAARTPRFWRDGQAPWGQIHGGGRHRAWSNRPGGCHNWNAFQCKINANSVMWYWTSGCASAPWWDSASWLSLTQLYCWTPWWTLIPW